MTALQKPTQYDYSNRLQRQHRQPQHEADFVLIDPYKFLEYSNLERLFDKLPTGLPMALNKAEKSNRYYHKWQVNEFSHFTPNHKKYIHSLVFDLDPTANPDNWSVWSDCGLPPPNLITANPNKPNSYQFWYLLEYPVYTSKQHIKAWLDDIYVAMRDLLNADKFFNRTRCKNPFSPEHDTYVSGATPYSLSELSDKCDLSLSAPYKAYKPDISQSATITPPKPQTSHSEPIRAIASNDPTIYAGRNDETFDKIRFVGYSNAHRPIDELYNLLLNACIQYQKRFDTPLDTRECEYIATSITKFCKERYLQGDFVKTGNYSDHAKQNFCNKQRNRAYRRWKGYKDKRKTALEMLEQNIKQKDICEFLSIDKATLYRWKKSNNIK
jgi:hypothetical protein